MSVLYKTRGAFNTHIGHVNLYLFPVMEAHHATDKVFECDGIMREKEANKNKGEKRKKNSLQMLISFNVAVVYPDLNG